MALAGAIHVAAGVVGDGSGRVLLARRHADSHQGGKWEFPGGKLEGGEPVAGGLRRELREELGIQVLSASPLIRVAHDYGERSILLDTWLVHDYRGEPHGREGQPLAWVLPEDFDTYPMPAADRPIVTALRLPERFSLDAVNSSANASAGRAFHLRRGRRREPLLVIDAQDAEQRPWRQEWPDSWIAARVDRFEALAGFGAADLDFLLLDAALHELPPIIPPLLGLPVYLLGEPGTLDPAEVRDRGAQGVAELGR